MEKYSVSIHRTVSCQAMVFTVGIPTIGSHCYESWQCAAETVVKCCAHLLVCTSQEEGHFRNDVLCHSRTANSLSLLDIAEGQ